MAGAWLGPFQRGRKGRAGAAVQLFLNMLASCGRWSDRRRSRSTCQDRQRRVADEAETFTRRRPI